MNDSKSNHIAIIDYGLGNLFSVQQACEHVGLDAVITDDIGHIMASDAVILPGVGAFADAMQALKDRDLVKPLMDVAQSQKPLIGICLGMQLLMTESFEFGTHKGLGLIEGEVKQLENQIQADRVLKVPEVGWNRIYKPEGHPVEWTNTPLEGLKKGEFVYFVHSFYTVPTDPDVILSVSSYGDMTFCSSLMYQNIFACQFHPERSSQQGLKIYRNIADHVNSFIRKDAVS